MSKELTPTDEQERIISSEAKVLAIDAFAGATKSTTLKMYAARRPNKRFIYVAYNRSIKLEAEKKFPKNVRCVTSHGLAFPTYGVKYQKKLGNPKAYHIAQALDIDNISAGKILETINHFLSTPDEVIGEEHALQIEPKANASTIGHLIDYSRTAWDMMQEPDGLMMSHDGYLKLYQLSNPVISCDTILYDEFQDVNPCTWDFIKRQRANKVLVGDRNQAIYGFRGSVNALATVQAEERMFLTKSFRFGDGIANLASEILHDWVGCEQRIQGMGKYKTVFQVDRNKPHAIISRTNGGLFAEAVALVSGTAPFGFCGGIEGYRMDMVLDTYYMWSSRRGQVRDAFINSFQSFTEMKAYGDALDDKEIKSLVKVVEEHQHDIPRLIDEIKRRAVPQLVGKEIALSTTHKAKGLEFQSVILTNDFTPLEVKKDEKGREVPPTDEEIHILYVALTRAIECIQLPEAVLDWMAREKKSALLNVSSVVATIPNQQRAPANATASKAAVPKESQDKFDKWRNDMSAYFDKVRDTYSNTATVCGDCSFPDRAIQEVRSTIGLFHGEDQ